jgi:hypothetical protein
VGGGTEPPADGASFSFGSDIAADYFNEDGSGSGLRVSFNCYPGNYVGCRLWWNNAIFLAKPYTFVRSPAEFVDTTVEMDALGRVTVKYGTDVVYDNIQIPGFAPITGNAKVAFSGRTGGLNQKNWIDDICVNDYVLGPVAVAVSPADTHVLEACGTTLTATASGSPPFFYQWLAGGVPIPGATASTYTTPPQPVSGSPYTYTVEANNWFSGPASDDAVVTVDPGCGPITLTPAATPGSVTINWSPCCRIQVTTELKSNPADTVWVDVNETPPLTVTLPVDLGAGPMPVLFVRAISP